MNRTVTFVQFKETPFVGAGLGQLPKTLPSVNKTLPAMSMTAGLVGVTIVVSGREIIVPWHNIVNAVLAPEAPAEKAPEAK